MEKNERDNQTGGVTHKHDKNAGSAAFNEGVKQDPDYDNGTKVSDEEKLTGHLQPKGAGKAGKTGDDGNELPNE